MFRSTMRTLPFCKVDFTILTKFAFFFTNICTYSQKAVSLHQI